MSSPATSATGRHGRVPRPCRLGPRARCVATVPAAPPASSRARWASASRSADAEPPARRRSAAGSPPGPRWDRPVPAGWRPGRRSPARRAVRRDRPPRPASPAARSAVGGGGHVAAPAQQHRGRRRLRAMRRRRPSRARQRSAIDRANHASSSATVANRPYADLAVRRGRSPSEARRPRHGAVGPHRMPGHLVGQRQHRRRVAEAGQQRPRCRAGVPSDSGKSVANRGRFDG